MKISIVIALLPLLLLASCASKSKPKKSAQPVHKSLSARLNQQNGYKPDAEGKLVPGSTLRSSYESRGKASEVNRSYQKKTYQTGDYAKKSEWGHKEYAHKAYSGNTNSGRSHQPSNLQGQSAHGATQNAKLPSNSKTNTYATRNAQEADNTVIPKPLNVPVERYQKALLQPKIIDWKEQRSLNSDQSKSILGH